MIGGGDYRLARTAGRFPARMSYESRLFVS